MSDATERTTWTGLFRDLGAALLGLAGAELAAFQRDLGRSGRHAAKGGALVVGAAMFAFWAVGTVAFFAVAVLARWLPWWGAALVVGGLFSLLTAGLLLAARASFRRVENPVVAARRRLDDHVTWWREQAEPEDRLDEAVDPDDRGGA